MSEKKQFVPSPEQQAFFDWVREGRGSCVLSAVAGAGKTTTLVEAVKLMRGSVFLGAYNKSMGDELRERIKGMDGKKAGTMHSAGFSALCRALPHLREKNNDRITDKKVPNIVDDLLAEREIPTIVGLRTAVCHLVSLAKQTGFYVRGLVPNVQPSYWAELDYRHEVSDRIEEDFPSAELYSLADAALKRSNACTECIDFDDMVYLPLLRNLRMFQNDWVLLDESQDTNAVRRELARRMLRPGGRLVAVGDEHQAIYGFTGADNRAMAMIQETFRATKMSLSVSWRCPRAVVAAAREYVGHIRPADTAPEGVVGRKTYREMLESVLPGQAVLCRLNAPLVDLCFRLIREGKPAKIEGRAIGEGLIALVTRWKVKTLDALETRLEKWLEREIAKTAGKKDAEMRIEKLEDKHATIVCLIERAREQGLRSVEELKVMVESIFDNGATEKGGCVVLSTVHRSKGLEWPVVHILGRGEIMPSKRARQDWQIEQEINLCYVAITRSQGALYDVTMPTEADLKRNPKKEEEKVA